MTKRKTPPAPPADLGTSAATDPATDGAPAVVEQGHATRIVNDAADLGEGALTLLEELHVVNSKLAGHGTNILELLRTVASKFQGIHI